jgi:uncharacterized membrane-anchored protein YitT (DUF2179 family)
MIRQIALFVVGLAAIVTGVSMFSVPAALMVGGLVVMAVALLYDFQPIKKGRP